MRKAIISLDFSVNSWKETATTQREASKVAKRATIFLNFWVNSSTTIAKILKVTAAATTSHNSLKKS